mmetsp:Transcript_58829/g.167288  ORF Transcript_58829/g.167288 Transcript_58829/m.167288 type:complete len:217 (-) Transcript_58829:241-891(-)
MLVQRFWQARDQCQHGRREPGVQQEDRVRGQAPFSVVVAGLVDHVETYSAHSASDACDRLDHSLQVPLLACFHQLALQRSDHGEHNGRGRAEQTLHQPDVAHARGEHDEDGAQKAAESGHSYGVHRAKPLRQAVGKHQPHHNTQDQHYRADVVCPQGPIEVMLQVCRSHCLPAATREGRNHDNAGKPREQPVPREDVEPEHRQQCSPPQRLTLIRW